MQDNTIIAVDFGSSTIRLAVGELTNGTLRVIGVFERHLNGVKNAVITNIEEASKSVRDILCEVNVSLYFYPKSVYIGLDMGVFKREQEKLGFLNKYGSLDINLLFNSIISNDKSVVFDDYINVFNKAGVEVVNFYPFPITTLSVLTDTEDRKAGVMIIDIGDNLTSVVTTIGGKIIMADSIPYGGADITNDIAYIFQKNKSYSKNIKEDFGSALPSLVNENDTFTLQESNTTIEFSKKEFSSIVFSRVNEILTLLKQSVDSVPRDGKCSKGIFVIGGTSLLSGVPKLTKEVFLLDARIGFPESLDGLQREYINPKFANLLGVLKTASGIFTYKNNNNVNIKPNEIITKLFCG